MKRLTQLSALALAFACSAATSTAFAAEASDNTATSTYRTALTQVYGSPYPVTGSLQLTDEGNGIFRGYYRPDDNGSFIPVTGGRDGKTVWMDIGANGRMKIRGHYEGHKIVGAIVGSFTGDQLKFVATPDGDAK